MVKIFTKWFFLCFFGVALAQVETAEEFSVTMTAYSSTRSQTDSTPFITSTNQRVRPGIVAASRDLLNSNLPYGSKLRVVAIKDTKPCGGWDPEMILEVQDTMHPRKSNQVDLWLPSTAKARKWGRCRVTLELLDSAEEPFVQTPSIGEEQNIAQEVIVEKVAESDLQPDLEQVQQTHNLFVEAANKVSVASFDFLEVTNVESNALVESNVTSTPTYDANLPQAEILVDTSNVNITPAYESNPIIPNTTQSDALVETNSVVPTYNDNTQTEVLVDAGNVNTAPAYDSNPIIPNTTQGEVLVEVNSVAPTYDANLNTPSTAQTTPYSAPKQQSLMELASQAFLIPLLQFAFSTPNTSEEMLDHYTRYYMQNSP